MSTKFWELEEIPEIPKRSIEDTFCEKIALIETMMVASLKVFLLDQNIVTIYPWETPVILL